MNDSDPESADESIVSSSVQLKACPLQVRERVHKGIVYSSSRIAPSSTDVSYNRSYLADVW